MNKNRRVYQKLNMFYTLLLSTILPCVLATVLLALVLLPMMKNVTGATDEAYGEVLLSSAGARMERTLDMIKDREQQFLNAEWLKKLYLDQLVKLPLDLDTKEDIVRELAWMVAAEPELYSVSFMLYEDPDTLYSSTGVFEDISFLQKISPDSVHYRFYAVDDSEAGFETIEFNGKSYLLYHTPFSVVSGGRSKGVLNMLLRHEMLGRELSEASEDHGQRFALLENDSEVWAFGDAASDVVDLSCAMGDGNLALTMSIPRQISTRTSGQVMPQTFLTLAVSLLISLGLSYLLSRFTYRPIQTVVERFAQGKKTTGNELLALQQVFENMLDEKSLAEATLAHLRPMARQKLLSGLLDGTAFLEDSVEDQMRYCRVLFDYEYCNVIAASMPFAQLATESCTTELAMETLAEHLCRDLPVHAFVYSRDPDNFQILINYDSWDHIQAFLSLLITNCKEYFRKHELEQQVFLGVGQAVQSPEELYRAAEQAETAVNVAALNRLEQPVFYREMAPELNYDYFYPMSEELLLARAITNGNQSGAKSLLYAVIEENKRKLNLNPKCLQLLYMDLSSTVSRSGQSLGVNTLPLNLKEGYLSLDEICERVEMMIDHICSQINAKRSKSINPAEQEILEYIDQHLYDPNLSLSAVGNIFRKSPSYISAIFKAHRDDNFNNYVNHARIMRAIQLMGVDGMDSSSVYPLVGYSNLKTFRRNFSKFAKQNPGQSFQNGEEDELEQTEYGISLGE